MSDHYYSPMPGTPHKRQVVETQLRGMAVKFATDAGVFSKSGLDFGSRLLIETLELPPTAHVLDVGCGYGPIGIAAAKLAHEGSVAMLDVNERAVALARENIALNSLTNAVALQSDLYAALEPGRVFDAIVTNPPIRAGKAIVHRIFEEAAERLVPGGALWVVIQKKQGAPSAKAKLEAVFGQVDEMAKDKGYRIFRALK